MTKKKEKKEPAKPSTFKINISGAVVGSPYSLYLEGQPRRYTQGVAPKPKFTLEIPAGIAKTARLTLTIKRTERAGVDLPLTVDFNLKDEVEINVEQEFKKTTSPPPETPTTSKPKKKLAINKLQEKVQKKKDRLKEEATLPPRGPGGRFVSKKKAEAESIDNETKETNNEKVKEKAKKSFWDRLR